MTDIMIDVETLDSGPEAHIVAIAAVPFDIRTGEQTGPHFYHLANEETNGTISAQTIAWWMGQSSEAREHNFGAGLERVAFPTLMNEFDRWLAEADPHNLARLWQRGCMDQVWIERAFKRLCFADPHCHFRQWCDQRTITKIARPTVAAIGTAHSALDDCYTQINDLVCSISQLGVRL